MPGLATHWCFSAIQPTTVAISYLEDHPIIIAKSIIAVPRVGQYGERSRDS